MLIHTLPRLRCPNCLDAKTGSLTLQPGHSPSERDVMTGVLSCQGCDSIYPILAGIALLVGDVEGYLHAHIQGIASLVDDSLVPEPFCGVFAEAKVHAQTDASEEDQESERVNALYFMNHYLSAAAAKSNPWWRPKKSFSPEIDRLVRGAWDNGPFPKISTWTKKAKNQNVVELGCGAGGLCRFLGPSAASYVGFDTSFVSIALARHLNLGAPYPLSLLLPQDLYAGPLTRKVAMPKPLKSQQVDFVVGEIQSPPLAPGYFDLAVSLNTIDVIEDPSDLPMAQYGLLREGGLAIVSSPFLWDSGVAQSLRDHLPPKVQTSSAAVEYIYERSGFCVSRRAEHVPWLFLEHFRKIGLYSLHLFAARRT